MNAPPPAPPRPRLLIPLALVGFFLGTIGTANAWATIVMLTGSHDRYTSAIEHGAERLLDLPKELGTPEQLQKVATREAEARSRAKPS